MEWQNYVRETQDSLRVLAEQTGGIAVVNQNDFDKALKRIDAETSDYYVLGYYSTNPDPTKKRRRLDVKVTRPGLNVLHRTDWYTLKAPPVSKDSEIAPFTADRDHEAWRSPESAGLLLFGCGRRRWTWRAPCGRRFVGSSETGRRATMPSRQRKRFQSAPARACDYGDERAGRRKRPSLPRR